MAQRRPLANGSMGVLAPMPTWVDTTVLLTGTHMPSPRLQPSSLALPRAFEHLQRSALGAASRRERAGKSNASRRCSAAREMQQRATRKRNEAHLEEAFADRMAMCPAERIHLNNGNAAA